MYLLYSFLLSIGFTILLPRFIFDALFNGKYSEGFWQRLGYLPEFTQSEHPVLWVHCVSVGETNAAFPIIKEILKKYPNYRLVVSTTTKTGQALAKKLFGDFADLVFYFPFDWKFTVHRTLKKINPNIVLLMESEIWFNFIKYADRSGAGVFIVNGRLSEKSFRRFLHIKKFMSRVFHHVTLAIMQTSADRDRISKLGLPSTKVKISGNVKFDQNIDGFDERLTEEIKGRFGISASAPLIVAASTHSPEEELILEAFSKIRAEIGGDAPRLMLVPRHPERFEKVAELVKKFGFGFARRSEKPANADQNASVILLDTIGELRAILPLAEIVFVGGSLIPHGGQNLLEAAAVQKAIVTGFYTFNFEAILKEFNKYDAVIQLPKLEMYEVADKLAEVFLRLIKERETRENLAENAFAVMAKNRGATEMTCKFLQPFMSVQSGSSNRPLAQ